jgi:hypothetical protein
MELIKDWKIKELEGYKKAYEQYKNTRDQLHNILKEYEEKLKLLKDITPNQDFINGHYINKELDDLYYQKENAKYEYYDYTYTKNRFFHENGYKKDFEERCKKQIDKHFDILQTKVEKKIGKILEIKPLGGNDYSFKGELADCKIEVILAGGYNIQRLHTRWIIKK